MRSQIVPKSMTHQLKQLIKNQRRKMLNECRPRGHLYAKMSPEGRPRAPEGLQMVPRGGPKRLIFS